MTPKLDAATQAQIDDHLCDDDHFDGEDDDDFLEMECGLMRDGQCSQAGTEHCDFVCPNRNSEAFCGSKAWLKKHGHS